MIPKDSSLIYITFIILIIYALVLYYVRKIIKATPANRRPLPFDRLSFYFNLFINIPLFVISIYSLYISRKTFLDAQVSGPAQQKTLDDSRKALEASIKIAISQREAIDRSTDALTSIVKLNTDQQEIATKSLKISSRQFSAITQQLATIKEQKRLMSLRPKLEFLIQNVPEQVIAQNKPIILRKQNLHIPPDNIYNTFIIHIKIKHTGEAVASNPYLVVVALPETVIIRNGDVQEYLNTQKAIFNNHRASEIALFKDYNEYLVQDVIIAVPHKIDNFYLGFKISCYNVPTRLIAVNFQTNLIE